CLVVAETLTGPGVSRSGWAASRIMVTPELRIETSHGDHTAGKHAGDTIERCCCSRRGECGPAEGALAGDLPDQPGANCLGRTRIDVMTEDPVS
ncbi:MAG: hypothetical protein ACRYF2_16630, partial [Janthinobacterium lividum]